MADMRFPTDPIAAVEQWMAAAKHAEELRLDTTVGQAISYMEAASLEAIKTTEAFCHAYATTQNVVKAQDAAAAAVEAKVSEAWAKFVLDYATEYGIEWEVDLDRD